MATTKQLSENPTKNRKPCIDLGVCCIWTYMHMVLEKTLESPLDCQGDPPSPSWRRSVLGVHWKDWCWSWNSNTLATSCEELTHWKRPWCREGLGAGGEGDDRGWDVWMASLTRWAWVWVNSRSWWWTGRPDVLQFMGSQGVGHDWVTELNWTKYPLKLSSGKAYLPPGFMYPSLKIIVAEYVRMT